MWTDEVLMCYAVHDWICVNRTLSVGPQLVPQGVKHTYIQAIMSVHIRESQYTSQ